MPYSYERLISHLRRRSRDAQTDGEIFHQWYMFKTEEGNADCNCGHENIIKIFHIKNLFTEQETFVGSVCIKRFPRFSNVRDLVRFIEPAMTQGVVARYIGRQRGSGKHLFRIPASSNLVRMSANFTPFYRNPIIREPWGRQRHRYLISVDGDEFFQFLSPHRGRKFRIHLRIETTTRRTIHFYFIRQPQLHIP